MSLWPWGKCQRQLFIWSNCSQEMWPKDNFGGDLFIQKNLDVVLFLFWSYHKSSGLSLWIVKVDGWWKGIADMEISLESKKIDHEVQKQPLVINNTLETPWMHRTSFQICVICWGEKSLCFRWLLWCLLMLFPPRSVCSQHHLTNIGWCGIETMQPTRGSQLCKRICEVKARWLVSYRCINSNKKRQQKFKNGAKMNGVSMSNLMFFGLCLVSKWTMDDHFPYEMTSKGATRLGIEHLPQQARRIAAFQNV